MLILKEEWRTHPKMLHAVFEAGSELVKFLWFEGVSECGEAKTDGVIEVYRLPLIARSCGLDAATTRVYVAALVKARLWHDADALAKCRPCRDALKEQGHRPGPDDLVVHDFLEHNPSKRNKGALGKKREKRKNDLGPGRRSEWVKGEVFARDRGLCRYCGCRPQDRVPNQPDSLEFDHVDPACFEPNHGNFTDGMVVSCRRCNRAKGEQTPDEAGMPLLAIGHTARDVAEGRAQYVASPCELPAPTPDAEGAPAGPEGVGAGSGPGRAGPGSGSGRDRDGGPAGTRSGPPGKGSRRTGGRPPPRARSR